MTWSEKLNKSSLNKESKTKMNAFKFVEHYLQVIYAGFP